MVVKSMSSAAEQVAAAVALTITVTDVAASARGAISSRRRLSFVSVWGTRRTLAPGAARRLRAAPRGDCGELPRAPRWPEESWRGSRFHARLSRKSVPSGAIKTMQGMGPSFIACDRDQSFLMPPDVRDWLPENHLAWFVLAAVEEMDLWDFYAAYRVDGRSRPAYEPAMMVALLLYAYARGIRSSRVIERACVEDVAFRVVAAQQRPDHATIARFIERHETAMAGLFGEVLLLCARSGLAQVGVIAVDGTKVQANASRNANVDYEQLAREIIEEAKATDAAEDELYGDRRGDELPDELATAQGRRGWLREAKRRLEAERDRSPQPVPRSRPKRVKEVKRRLEEELFTEMRANAAYENYRARDRMRNGRRLGTHSPPKPYTPPATPEGRINTTDPDSRVVKGLRGFIQGYNAQAVTNEHQIVIAAEVMTAAPDFGLLEPMLDAARRELDAAGIDDVPGVVLADAGYWHQHQMEHAVAEGM